MENENNKEENIDSMFGASSDSMFGASSDSMFNTSSDTGDDLNLDPFEEEKETKENIEESPEQEIKADEAVEETVQETVEETAKEKTEEKLEKKVEEKVEEKPKQENLGDNIKEEAGIKPESEEKTEKDSSSFVETEDIGVIETTDTVNDKNSNELVTVRPVKFKEFEDVPPVHTIKRNYDIMQDISMHVSVELGRTKSTIKEVMDLEQGSIIELNKIAGEQVELYVNDKFVAQGEVIVIEDRFGVRVTNTNLQNVNPNP